MKEAFDVWMETVSEDAADDLIGLAQEAFEAGWKACLAVSEEKA